MCTNSTPVVNARVALPLAARVYSGVNWQRNEVICELLTLFSNYTPFPFALAIIVNVPKPSRRTVRLLSNCSRITDIRLRMTL